ncbi:hypothetical protein GCM10011360_42090 [Primorskyibacter flagellatus]|uniref:Flagellar hook-length control protein-like C-terminal domain-containing protein n=1 Tax=Primorskyibacter flagellatus TaxID=1387277 RepID=A0A917AHC4_9RHOB|nr:flagellar hook-length control protein FliK [Primorskyibacter flagellatus]GGE50635.1 hypothetical protein GCM10011360_42090 [Primorskyibacter flagellatus]
MVDIFSIGAGVQAQAGKAAGKGSVGAESPFAALLAQALGGEAPASETAAEGKAGKLAALIGKIRSEAQESLAEAFPDGVIQPGAVLNDWARGVLTQLDGALKEAGLSVADLMQVLGPLDTAALAEPGSLLVQAAGVLLEDAGVVAAQPGVPVTAQAGIPGAVPVAGDAAAAPVVAAATPAAVPVGDAVKSVEKTGTLAVAAEVVTDAQEASSPGPVQTQTQVQAQVQTQVQAAPLPDALRIVLAQVVAAPGDKGLPPEIQAILATPQSAAPAPQIHMAPVAPVPAPSQTPDPNQGLARNLAGQIRGVSFNEGTTRIELSPQGLGRLEIEIAPDETGRLRVVLRAENPAVLNAMRSDRDMLAGLLRDGGASVDNSSMSFEDLGQRRNPLAQDPAAPSAPRAAAPEEEEQPQPEQEVVEDGRLNILT